MRELMRSALNRRGGGGKTPLSPRAVWVLLAVAALVWWLQPAPLRSPGSRGGGGGVIEGHARVIDGDSVVVAGREMRLQGIDAPEGRQHCTRGGADWACGEEARRHLQSLIGGRPLTCRADESDQHGRLLSVCEVAGNVINGRSLNAAMVDDGFAVAYGRYRSEEQRARSARRGLWSGEFQQPREWRDQHPRP